MAAGLGTPGSDLGKEEGGDDTGESAQVHVNKDVTDPNGPVKSRPRRADSSPELVIGSQTHRRTVSRSPVRSAIAAPIRGDAPAIRIRRKMTPAARPSISPARGDRIPDRHRPGGKTRGCAGGSRPRTAPGAPTKPWSGRPQGAVSPFQGGNCQAFGAVDRAKISFRFPPTTRYHTGGDSA